MGQHELGDFPDDQIQSLTGPAGTVRYTYDRTDRLATVSSVPGSPTTTYTWNLKTALFVLSDEASGSRR